MQRQSQRARTRERESDREWQTDRERKREVLTISGRFWSITSSLRKQWLTIWLWDWHMTWTEAKQPDGMSTQCHIAPHLPPHSPLCEILPMSVFIVLPLSGSCSANHCSCLGNLSENINNTCHYEIKRYVGHSLKKKTEQTSWLCHILQRYRWHCSWPPLHNAAAWTPPYPLPCESSHLPTCDWKQWTGTDRFNVQRLADVKSWRQSLYGWSE